MNVFKSTHRQKRGNSSTFTMETTEVGQITLTNANYIETAICCLAEFYNKLPKDNQYSLNNNMWNITSDYADLHKLLLEELQRALKAYDSDAELIDENHENIKELYNIFEDLLSVFE